MTEKQTLQNFVDGRYVAPADGGYADLIDPSTGEVFAAGPVSGAADVDARHDRRGARLRLLARHAPRPSASGRC